MPTCRGSLDVKIAILPGDGIGPELVAEAVRVLDVLRRGGLAVDSDTAPIGGAGFEAAKVPLPEATQNTLCSLPSGTRATC